MIGLWVDRRISGRPVSRDSTELMRAPDEIRDCVCFLEARMQAVSVPFWQCVLPRGAYGFTDNPIQDQIAVYAITARHCLQVELPNKMLVDADEIVLHINSTDGRRSVGDFPFCMAQA
jgi:hypothetical protein